MPSYNKIILMGNITRDPDMNYTQGGQAICKLGIAVNNSYTAKDGKKVDKTLFLDLTARGKTGETMAQYLHKGDPIFVEGRLELETWEDKDGGKRSKHSMTVERFQFLPKSGSKGDAAPEEDGIPF